MQLARLKQQGRRFPSFIFEIVTSTRRRRVSGLLVALTQRTHSHRAIGVMSSQMSRIFDGAADVLFRAATYRNDHFPLLAGFT